MLLLLLTLFVSLGVFLFGYDQGVMSGIITNELFKIEFGHPTPTQIGWVVAILEIGALVSSLVSGSVSDKLGRKNSILLGAIVFCIGSILQVAAAEVNLLMAGRAVAGLGIGLLSSIVPVYQSEISEAHNRGQLACVEYSGNTLGYASSVWIGFASSGIRGNWSWRLPLAMQLLLGGILLVGGCFIPETPRWLANNNRSEEARIVLRKLGSKDEVLDTQMEQQLSYRMMFKLYKRRVLIAMSAQMFAQLNGINVISYYAPLVFEQAGFKNRKAVLMTGINSLFYLLATTIPWVTIEKWGRRKMLIYGGMIMAIFLTLMSAAIFSKSAMFTVIFVIGYNFAFGCSWGPVPWLYPPEIMPLSVRARGAALSTASNWFFNFIVGVLVPDLQQVLQWRLYLIPAAFSLISIIVVYYFYPETKGIELEDMDRAFRGSARHMNREYTPLREAVNGFGMHTSGDHETDGHNNARSRMPSIDGVFSRTGSRDTLQ